MGFFNVKLMCRCEHLWSVHEVHLQQAGLQRPLRGSVVLQSVQQERGALLDQVVLHEHVHDLHTWRHTGEQLGRETGTDQLLENK